MPPEEDDTLISVSPTQAIDGDYPPYDGRYQPHDPQVDDYFKPQRERRPARRDLFWAWFVINLVVCFSTGQVIVVGLLDVTPWPLSKVCTVIVVLWALIHAFGVQYFQYRNWVKRR